MPSNKSKKDLISNNSPLEDIPFADATKHFRRSEPEESMTSKPALTAAVLSSPTSEKREKRSFTVLLPIEQIEWVDAKHAEARSQKGHPFRKTAILRAVLDVVMASEVNLAGSQKESELRERLLMAIKEVELDQLPDLDD